MKKWLVVLALCFVVWHYWSGRSVPQSPGVLAPGVPEQVELASARSFDLHGYRITPLARFSLKARVLAKSDYHLGREAELAPVDIAFGWGSMSDSAVLEHIDISQSNRFYFWRTSEPPIPLREIELSSANMHLIPASSSIERVLKIARPGQVLQLEGKLVRADAADGWYWQSSLTREDTGNGACELVYVESASSIQ